MLLWVHLVSYVSLLSSSYGFSVFSPSIRSLGSLHIAEECLACHSGGCQGFPRGHLPSLPCHLLQEISWGPSISAHHHEAAVSILGHSLVDLRVSSGYVPRSGTAGSRGRMDPISLRARGESSRHGCQAHVPAGRADSSQIPTSSCPPTVGIHNHSC